MSDLVAVGSFMQYQQGIHWLPSRISQVRSTRDLPASGGHRFLQTTVTSVTAAYRQVGLEGAG